MAIGFQSFQLKGVKDQLVAEKQVNLELREEYSLILQQRNLAMVEGNSIIMGYGYHDDDR
jgi:hypothetical protein